MVVSPAELKIKMSMKKLKIFSVILAMAACFALSGCEEYPLDENGLLITDKTESLMTSLALLGSDHVSVLVGTPVINNETGVVTAVVKYGTNLGKLKPSCGTSIDAIVTPKMGVWTDFSNMDSPLKYTVISGDRKHSTTYEIKLTVQAKP